ncbi:MAG: DUF3795 domain-containing protein [Bacteroidales bacterium]|nr:DUF3795 domain-containing protein [Bacteroidales bacterium]
MNNTLAKCGCDCINCPTYRENVKTSEDRKKCSTGWERFLKIKLSPEKLRACDGCSIPDLQRKTYYLNCRVRKCAIINEMENCAYCTGFPCNELLEVHSLQKISNREDFIKTSGKEISASDYRYFIEPYAGLVHLNRIRQTLTVNDYKDYKRYSPKTGFADFNQSGLQENLIKIHKLLTSLYVEENISYARLQTVENKRERILKILWTIGLYGTYNKNLKCIELDAKTFMNQKVHGMYKSLIEYFELLKEYDIHGEIIPLVEKGWLTPMGGLRKEGWIIRFKFGDSKDMETDKTFINFIHQLSVRYGNSAFKKFKRADLRLMII